METVKLEDIIETPNKLAEADQFDLAQVKKMTSLKFPDDCDAPIFKWPLIEVLINSKPWESVNFPLNGDQRFGQIAVDCVEPFWNLTVTACENEQKELEPASEMTSSGHYFILRYHFDGNYSRGREFCKEIFVFGDKNAASVSWNWYWPGCHSIFIEVYRAPAAIPDFFAASDRRGNMIVGKCEMSVRAKDEDYEFRTFANFYKEPLCFNFGSADQQLTFTFKSQKEFKEVGNMGLTATLRIVRNVKTDPVPFALTLTIFNQRDGTKDLVKRLVVRPEEKELEQDMDVAFYGELDDTTEDNTLYFKVVLEPLNPM